MTDWDAYYKAPPKATSITRGISQRKIIGILKKYSFSTKPSICEIGGANSCFGEAVSNELDANSYHVIDSNEYGLKLLREKKHFPCSLTFENRDILSPSQDKKKFDIVYSVGLIEHFNTEETARVINEHFSLCVNNGLVLLTFPTPTPLYRFIRSSIELAGKWIFYDERPLKFEEVLNVTNDYGCALECSVNWYIGLTQGYILVRKYN